MNIRTVVLATNIQQVLRGAITPVNDAYKYSRIQKSPFDNFKHLVFILRATTQVTMNASWLEPVMIRLLWL